MYKICMEPRKENDASAPGAMEIASEGWERWSTCRCQEGGEIATATSCRWCSRWRGLQQSALAKAQPVAVGACNDDDGQSAQSGSVGDCDNAA
jgi:hypothetical protein